MDLKSAVISGMCFLVGHNILLNFRRKVTIVVVVSSLVVVIVMMSSGSGTSMANGTKGRINFLFFGSTEESEALLLLECVRV